MSRDRYRHRSFDDGFPTDDGLDFSRRRRDTARGRRQMILAGMLVAGLFIFGGLAMAVLLLNRP